MKEINNYIDRCLIDEYAAKSFKHGYSLDIDDLPEHERATFLDVLMKNDTSVRDYVLSQMQELINKRLSVVEVDDRQDAGISLHYLTNGDYYLRNSNRGIA